MMENDDAESDIPLLTSKIVTEKAELKLDNVNTKLERLVNS